ncbi:MAG TPA: hypothetical protein PLO37_19705 [Candidatus Hydrogenedentes bacterium]|nr:hypothetical protein [Candidatus Hydrogenedentota bacterium]
MKATLDAAELKQLLKDALSELLDERREDFRDLLAETLEDMGMVKAIEEGEDTPLVDKETVLGLLDEAP